VLQLCCRPSQTCLRPPIVAARPPPPSNPLKASVVCTLPERVGRCGAAGALWSTANGPAFAHYPKANPRQTWLLLLLLLVLTARQLRTVLRCGHTLAVAFSPELYPHSIVHLVSSSSSVSISPSSSKYTSLACAPRSVIPDVDDTTLPPARLCYLIMMVAVVQKNQSLANMRVPADGAIPSEFNNAEYLREVLQFESGQTEALFDNHLIEEAEKLGIVISRPASPIRELEGNGNYGCDSANTEESNHARTRSSGSQGSGSTGLTSRSSTEHLNNGLAKRPSVRRSLSFTEY